MSFLAREKSTTEYARIKRGVDKAIIDIRERGFCTSIGDWRNDVNAAGVPVITADRYVYAINCGGPAFKVTRESLEKDLGPRLVELAERISARRTL
jgi:DNA-binding IclR family transcriptional regulator